MKSHASTASVQEIGRRRAKLDSEAGFESAACEQFHPQCFAHHLHDFAERTASLEHFAANRACTGTGTGIVTSKGRKSSSKHAGSMMVSFLFSQRLLDVCAQRLYLFPAMPMTEFDLDDGDGGLPNEETSVRLREIQRLLIEGTSLLANVAAGGCHEAAVSVDLISRGLKLGADVLNTLPNRPSTVPGQTEPWSW